MTAFVTCRRRCDAGGRLARSLRLRERRQAREGRREVGPRVMHPFEQVVEQLPIARLLGDEAELGPGPGEVVAGEAVGIGVEH
jgi:hypothetical protein